MSVDYLDTVVIGAGMAGLSVAGSSARDVLVLESGVEDGAHHKNSMPERSSMDLWHRTDSDPTFRRYWSSNLPPHFHAGSGVRERVGGRSLYWHGVCLPIEDRVLDSGEWPDDVVRTLRAPADIPSSYAATLLDMDKWISEKGAGPFLAECRGPREESLMTAVRSSGFDVVPVPQAAYAQDVQGELQQIAYSPWTDWKNGHVTMATGSRVTAIRPVRSGYEIDYDRDGRTTTVGARRVVVAAGLMESTRLVGELLMDLRGERSATFPGLNDHIVSGFVARLRRGVLNLDASQGRAFCYVPMLDEADSNLFFDVVPEAGDEFDRLAVWTMGEKLPGETSVTVTRDRHGRSEVVVKDPVLPADLDVVERQQAVLAQVASQLLGVDSGIDWPGREGYLHGGPNWMTALERATLSRGIKVHPYVYPQGASDHESGTLPLGKVLDAAGRLPEAPGLSVAGPAAYPRSGAANPSLTNIALARTHLARLDEG